MSAFTFRGETGHDGDDLLMLRYARGDIAAFEELYDRYASRLYDFCLRQLGDSDVAGDALQEVFRRVVDARSTYAAQGRFTSWIFTIARRVCADHWRRANREVPVESVADRYELQASAASDVEDEVADRDELQRLLALLPPQQREVLLLSKYHGFTYREIAEMLDSTEVAVRQKVYRALKALRGHARSPDPPGT